MKKWFFLFVLIIPASLFAQDSIKSWNFDLDGYLKFNTISLYQNNSKTLLTENMIHNRFDFTVLYKNKFKWIYSFRNRFIYGEFIKFIPSYSKLIDEEKGFIDLSFLLIDNKNYLLHTIIDRAYAEYNTGRFSIRAGRQRINWSQTYAWNPNDIFNAYNFFDFDYEIKPGSDALRLIYYSGALSQLELAVKADYKNRITAASLFKFNKWSYDFQLIAGIMNNEDLVAGTGWSGDLLHGGFRSEMSVFLNKNKLFDTSACFIASVGYEYIFKNSLMLLFEALYNSQGYKKGNFDLNEFYYNDLTAKNLSLTRLSLLISANYPLTPLINATLSMMYSPNNQFMYIGPSITGSISDNISVQLTTQSFFTLDKSTPTSSGSFIFSGIKASF